MPSGPLTYDVERAGPAATVRLHGDLDWNGVLRLEPELSRLLGEEGVRELTLDLAGLGFLDSTGMGLVIETSEAARRGEHELHLRPGPEEVQRVFRVAGVEDVLPFNSG